MQKVTPVLLVPVVGALQMTIIQSTLKKSKELLLLEQEVSLLPEGS